MLGVNGSQSDTPSIPVKEVEIVEGNRILRSVDDHGLIVKTQKGHKTEENYSELSDREFLFEFMKPSYWDIDHLTPTAWGGHIPFLFCLVSMSRPRSYAELGTHFGASFFAYCQACVRKEIRSTPVAIDCWEGDEHTGAYEESVFQQFRHHYSFYDHFAKYLRMYFDEAAQHIENGSLDLLHICLLYTSPSPRDS